MCSILAWCSPSASFDTFKEALDRSIPRGPDMQRITPVPVDLWALTALPSWA